MDKLPINPGTILLCQESKVIGGKRRITKMKSQSAINAGDGQRTEFDVKIEVENVEERREAENLIQRAVQAIRAHSTLTSIGYLCDAEGLTEVVKKFSEIKLAADTFNKNSGHSKAHISFIPIEIGGTLSTNEECAKALADHVRGELEGLYDSLRAGDAKRAKNILLGCRRMHVLSVGTQADAIKFAIEDSAKGLKILNRRITDGETPESAGRALKLPMVESAIETFTYAPENHVPALPANVDAPATDEEMAEDGGNVQALVA